jgi:hypothetical protein
MRTMCELITPCCTITAVSSCNTLHVMATTMIIIRDFVMILQYGIMLMMTQAGQPKCPSDSTDYLNLATSMLPSGPYPTTTSAPTPSLGRGHRAQLAPAPTHYMRFTKLRGVYAGLLTAGIPGGA